MIVVIDRFSRCSPRCLETSLVAAELAAWSRSAGWPTPRYRALPSGAVATPVWPHGIAGFVAIVAAMIAGNVLADRVASRVLAPVAVASS